MKIKNVINFYDINKLPKRILKEICLDLDIDDNGTSSELAVKISEQTLQKNNVTVFEKYEEYLLAGRGSISWFKVTGSLYDLEKNLKAFSDSPFEKVITKNNNDLTTEPLVFAATEPLSDKYFLRLAFRDGNSTTLSMAGREITPKITQSTVLVDTEKNILEVRASSHQANKIATKLIDIVNNNEKTTDEVEASQINILSNFDNEAGELANKLNGNLRESMDIPNQLYEDITDEQVQSIAVILKSIDKALQTDDIKQLITELENSKDTLVENFPNAPFLSLILAGLGTVRLGKSIGIDDLRESPLYETLAPYLENQGGYIDYPYNEAGVTTEGSIQVGKTTQTINFSKFASENAIRKVRDVILGSWSKEGLGWKHQMNPKFINLLRI